jgi:hypothetical protein
MERRDFLRYAGAWGAAAICAVPARAARAGMGVAAALNLSGRQRMLSQRLAKAWVMRGLGILPGRAAAILDDSLALQREQLAELSGFTPNDEVKAALGHLERSWQAYRAALAAPSGRGLAQTVYERSEQTQERAHRLTLAYEKASRAPGADRLVNIAGRQRMLSQRLAKFYLFGVWGVNPLAAQMEVNFARAEFSSGMKQLFDAVGEAPALRPVLEDLDRAWIGYHELFVTSAPAGFQRQAAGQIAEQSEHILPIAERLVALLEQYAQSRSS